MEKREYKRLTTEEVLKVSDWLARHADEVRAMNRDEAAIKLKHDVGIEVSGKTLSNYANSVSKALGITVTFKGVGGNSNFARVVMAKLNDIEKRLNDLEDTVTKPTVTPISGRKQ